ncbi:Hint domain-containing protein [Streptomyces sp. V4I2]|uniref:Hint domain-containing protein n=1 Tax=Streptomyces sp. V4I2 TaxID=3042280 RepID=UPI0027884CE5|nr:Hint domain-containing protein [Streptomyces sp. V4I2]MDQ1047978.1 preprotein translocase subunit YajC [Streptomyces sp. V4I2]
MGGSISSCANLLIGAIPFTAMFKKGAQFIKGAWKIARAVKKWRKEQKWADDILESAASCEVKHSFLPGTKVLLADGTTKNIEDVKTGDVVLVTDPETGRTVKRKIVRTISTEDDKHFTTLTVAAKNGPSTLTATDHHPFWVPDLKKWVNAGDLKPGQYLRTSAGTHVQITAVAHYTKRQRTHDLTVDEVHTYYVLAGATPLLVHNCSPSSDDLYNSALKPFRKPGGDHEASRSYQKHTKATGRDDSTLLPLNSGKDRKDMSEYLVEDILTNPKSARRDYTHSDHGDVIEISLPDVGARWSSGGDFIGFIDHPSYR